VKRIILALIPVIVFGLTGFARFSDLLDAKGSDLLLKGHGAHPDIAILAVDTKSISEIGRWPWDRQVFADTLAKLNEISPRAVGIDINFRDPGANDTALAQSVRNASFPIVLPVELVRFSDGSFEFAYPSDILRASGVRTGHVEVPPSVDGIARHFPVALKNDGTRVVPFSFELAETSGARLPSEDLDVNFAGPAGSFPTYSVSDFLAGAVPKERLESKIVLIGATASDLHDMVQEPLHNGYMAGVEWHANVLDNILLSRPLRRTPESLVRMAGFAVVLLLFIVSSRRKKSGSLGLYAGLFMLFPLVSWIALQNDILIPFAWNNTLVLVALGTHTALRWFAAEAEKRRIRRNFENYFSPTVLEKIVAHPEALSLGGERQNVSVLFSDIRSFTTISESLSPEALTKLLQEYFTVMTDEILKTDGVLDKYIGDAIMAFWGAPIAQADHADRAVKAAQGMMKSLNVLQEKWVKEGLPFVDIGIGVHTGPVIVGNMGSEKRFDYTIIGDTVNLASRLEGLNKEYKSHVIISEATKEALSAEVPCKELGDVVVKGKTQAVKIFEIKST
jgi:adenylate cyclase